MGELNARLFADAASKHGEMSSSIEAEVTDLQNMLAVAIGLLPTYAKAQFVRSETVMNVLHDGGAIVVDDPEAPVIGYDRISIAISGAHPCRNCRRIKPGEPMPCPDGSGCVAWKVFSTGGAD